ncbi:hypothetical protein COV13_02485 [Candidatus Woesearchaeota archaeon CG10_big_fil_rev_8_21_14_0_10_32_9]|nr:MAG: hypothetical protein COV13_02485 [Candidatus Woesearchaeota archaeon CG10_big_fil_rev_8_21_14_0_10_32_9]
MVLKMKLFRTLIKNFKLLIRSKGSAVVVLFAPLLIVLIIGVSFTDDTQNTLNIGVKVSESNLLTQRYLEQLNTTENNLIYFDTNDSCINSIKDGLTVTCIVFPDNFVLENNKTNEIRFYVDNSRTNFVYQLIADLTLNLGNESQEVSDELTSDLLTIVSVSSLEVSESLRLADEAKSLAESSKSLSDSSKSSLNNLDVSEDDFNLDGVTDIGNSVDDDFTSLKADAQATLTQGYNLVDEIESKGFVLAEKDSFVTKLDALNETLLLVTNTSSNLTTLLSTIQDAEDGVKDLQDKLSDARDVKSSVLSSVSSMSSNLNTIHTNLANIKTRQENVMNKINAFNFTTSGSISNPVSTKVETLSSKNNKTTYAFPYLLMLVILFVGMMLSSTLVFIEKDSRAMFRNFTTPTRDGLFIFSTYLTALIIILIQTITILVLAYFALKVPVLSNLGISAAMLFLGITMSVALGMLIGNIFSTSEGMTMTSIGIGSILIFLSNLILPLETLSHGIQSIAKYNPYVIASEGIRKAMLFNSSFEKLYLEMIILAGISIVLVAITIIIRKINSASRIGGGKKKSGLAIINVPEEQYLRLESKNVVVRNLLDLLDALRNIDDADYKTFTKPNNVFANWLKNDLREPYLARKVKRKSRISAIKFLEKYTQK